MVANQLLKHTLMKLECYQIDAFTDKIFGGNPACVVPLNSWLPDTVLLNIARENAVAETAFFVDEPNGFHLRWFTPDIEMDLCGHATLAAAHCLKSILKYPKDSILFKTASGHLKVAIHDDVYSLDFPSRMPVVSKLPACIAAALSIPPKEVYKSRDYMLVYETEQDIKNLTVNRSVFDQINLDPGGVIVTAKGEHCDFVSRFFTPQATILEDPVTGSAHCSLIPFWALILGKDKLNAQQISDRHGTLYCENKKERVIISGTAKTYAIGSITTG